MQTLPLSGRIALVTGASRGIGRGIALALARAGADIAVNFRRDERAATEVVNEIVAMGRSARAYHASVDDYVACAAMIEAVVADFGGLSILINNAGIASRGQSVADTDPAEMERVVRIHAFGPHYMSKLAIPHLRKNARSDIVMISSVATLTHSANGAPYNMGKAATEALALTLAKEEGKENVETAARIAAAAASIVIEARGAESLGRLGEARARAELVPVFGGHS